MTGQVIMISGISGQIGHMLVSTALERGAKVLGIDVSMTEMEKTAVSQSWDVNNIFMVEADIRCSSGVKVAFESGVSKFGYVTSQINNAGVSVFSPWMDRTEEEFDLVTNVNLKGSFNCMKVFMQHCIDTKRQGSIVNVASHYGLISPDPKIYTDCARRSPEIYGATKAGVIQMTKYFAVHLAERNIRTNSISPGGVYNPKNPQGDQFIESYKFRCPMKRMANSEEISNVAVFLGSQLSSYVNGQNITVDGGMSAW